MFDVLVVEFISICARNQIGVEFEGQLKDGVVFNTVGLQCFNGVREGLGGKFDDLVVGVDPCHFEYFVFQDGNCVVQIYFHRVFAVSLYDTYFFGVGLDCYRLNHWLVDG